MLAIPATGTYRGLQSENDWAGIRQMSLLANFKDFVEQESILELRNGAMAIEAARKSNAYQHGVGYWNHLVFRFVPAQLLGSEFKESLMFKGNEETAGEAVRTIGYEIPIGSTITGMGDSFQQFGWFGCLFFLLLAVLFRSLFEAALKPGAIFAQLFYIVITTSAMRAITHWTLDFLPGFHYFALFLGAGYWYARERPAPARARERRHRSAGLRTGAVQRLSQRAGSETGAPGRPNTH